VPSGLDHDIDLALLGIAVESSSTATELHVVCLTSFMTTKVSSNMPARLRWSGAEYRAASAPTRAAAVPLSASRSFGVLTRRAERFPDHGGNR
jgi:hypothetical protein